MMQRKDLIPVSIVIFMALFIDFSYAIFGAFEVNKDALVIPNLIVPFVVHAWLCMKWWRWVRRAWKGDKGDSPKQRGVRR